MKERKREGHTQRAVRIIIWHRQAEKKKEEKKIIIIVEFNMYKGARKKNEKTAEREKKSLYAVWSLFNDNYIVKRQCKPIFKLNNR